MSYMKIHELIIIGAGPGGYRAAFMAADLGMKVTLIDPEVNPGGVCLYRGCIPTKALLHLAKIKKEAEDAREMGLNFSTLEMDMEKIRDWKNQVVKKLTDGLGQLVKARKINYIRGYASFTGPNTIHLKQNNGETEEISFEQAIIATGVKPVKLPGIDYHLQGIMTPEQALELKESPHRLLIIGGGYIGLEMATIYHSLGSKVSIAELTSGFMPGMDRDLVAEYRKSGEKIFEEFFLETRVLEIKKSEKLLRVTFENKQKKKFSKTYDQVLIAVGQKPDTDSLGLEKIPLEPDEKGFIKVDEQQRTTCQNIFAIGDITGPPLLAHKASYEGMVAAEVLAGKKSGNEAKTIPSVIYTEPEIATCGLSEKQAKENGLDYQVVKFPWSASGRATAMHEKTGFTKLIINRKDERLLGAGIVGKNAGDLIPELVLAIEMSATAGDIALTIHPHPTLGETIMEAAELFYGHPAHIFMKNKKE